MSFDPDSFLNTTTTQAGDTRLQPVPVGEYPALVTEVKARQWTGKSDPTKSGVALDLTWELESMDLKHALGRDKITVKQGIMLDLTPDGALDFGTGRNVSLGRLREAVGLNTPGQPFAFSMLQGRAANVKVTHRLVEDEAYPEVKSVSAM